MTRTLLSLLFAYSLVAAQPSSSVRVRTGGNVVDLPLERYVAAVLAGESGDFQSAEALKAMAVAARTYAVKMRGRHRDDGFDFCDTTHCQRIDLKSTAARLESAAEQTAGELLWYQGKPAFTPYTRDCGGRTEDAAAVWPELAAPYLKSRTDDYCARAGRSAWRWAGDPRGILEALRRSGLRAPAHLGQISILDRTPSGRAATLLLSGAGDSVRVGAGSLRFAIGREIGWNAIRSDRYSVRSSSGRVIFEGSGSGHGVGLCQLGAEQMGLEGRPYHEILAFYYPGTAPGHTGRGLTWQRLSGETIALLTTQPGSDRMALDTAERLARKAAGRTGWPLPPNIEIRAYPDLDTFRDATGEPGWVAAHTRGRSIELQPVAVLRSSGALESTLSHELLHILLESQAAPSLPLWFREGLANYLAAGRGSGDPRAPSDAELRDIRSDAQARRAYADATAMLANLVARYGETAVLSWVKRGLPAEVINASSSQAVTKNK